VILVTEFYRVDFSGKCWNFTVPGEWSPCEFLHQVISEHVTFHLVAVSVCGRYDDDNDGYVITLVYIYIYTYIHIRV